MSQENIELLELRVNMRAYFVNGDEHVTCCNRGKCAQYAKNYYRALSKSDREALKSIEATGVLTGKVYKTFSVSSLKEGGA